MNNKPTVLFW